MTSAAVSLSPRRWPALVGVLAALASSPGAHAVPATPPPPQPMAELRFPAFAEQTLANGLRVILIERHREPAVSLRLVLPAGKLYDPSAKPGLATATADLLTQGTSRRSAQEIAATIDGIGGSLDAASSADFTYVSAAATSDQLPLALDLLSDIVIHPSFPATELERWRSKSLSALELQRANAGYLAGLAFQRAIFGSYPYGLPQAGTSETLRALKPEDLAAFHRSHFLPNGSLLAVVGDFQSAPTIAAVEAAFGSWQRGDATPPPALQLPTYSRHRVLVIDKPDAVQTQIRVGQAALAYTDPDYFTAVVYNAILGGGTSGRLFQEIRRKRGLAYGAYSGFAQQLTSGAFSANTSTKTASTVEALRLTLELIDGMAKAPVPAAEIDEAKAFLNGSFPLDIETASKVASRVLTAFSYGLGREFLDRYRERISAVTAADIQRFAAQRLHGERMVIVLVGNAKGFATELTAFVGPYETIPAADLDPLRESLRRPPAGPPPGGK